MTEELFREDAYLKTCEAEVIAVNERGGVLIDRSIFYPTGGGQPGDRGTITTDDGREIAIATTVYDGENNIVLVPAEAGQAPAPGSAITCRLDWELRHAHMRTHTALHLLCALVPFHVTGGQIAALKGRLDFDVTEGALDKDALTEGLNALVAADHGVTMRWITDAELAANPGLVRTMSVKPPTGSGRVRLIEIAQTDLQPCGGTHVARLSEIGRLSVPKIESKGAQNRRVRIEIGQA